MVQSKLNVCVHILFYVVSIFSIILTTRTDANSLGNLSGQDNTSKYWVFFKDKGESTDYDSLSLQYSNISERAKIRREKNKKAPKQYYDIKVNPAYVETISDIYGAPCQKSRWLNAASFYLDSSGARDLESLPFISKVIPVAKYYRIDLPGNNDLHDKVIDQNYGNSFLQLEMINVPSLHSRDFSGQNIVVGIFDSGFRKSHEAFAYSLFHNRLLAERDFVFNDDETQDEIGQDIPGQHNHGTYTWSTLGGMTDGKLIGPAYDANFILAKTEDIGFENPTEEDNWVAALEWAESLGVDIISSSLSYSDWYDYEDMDGNSAVITQASNIAFELGVLVVTSAGNLGPAAGTITAPADAYNNVACGSVNFNELISDFSSRGPTFDGRIKPELCALGESVYCAGGFSDTSYYYISGTSMSTPLIAGAAAVILSSNPYFTASQLRQALIFSGDKYQYPDNDYGFGIPNAEVASNWGANFYSDIQQGDVPLSVQFYDSSTPEPIDDWKWYFGNGDSSDSRNPICLYDEPGIYDVTLVTHTFGELIRTKREYIKVFPQDLLRGDPDLSYTIDILDITFIIAFLYFNGQEPPVLELADVNGNGVVNLLDVTYLINYLYMDGPAPPPY